MAATRKIEVFSAGCAVCDDKTVWFARDDCEMNLRCPYALLPNVT